MTAAAELQTARDGREQQQQPSTASQKPSAGVMTGRVTRVARWIPTAPRIKAIIHVSCFGALSLISSLLSGILKSPFVRRLFRSRDPLPVVESPQPLHLRYRFNSSSPLPSRSIWRVGILTQSWAVERDRNHFWTLLPTVFCFRSWAVITQ